MQRTLSIIKPDAVAKNVIGKIVDRFETNGLKIAAMKKIKLSEEVAAGFYAELTSGTGAFFIHWTPFAAITAPAVI